MTELEQFYEKQPAELREVYLALKKLILSQDHDITPEWRYKLPFFYYKGKMLCYFWFHKKLKQPYISFMDANLLLDQRLLMEDRKRAGILLINTQEDLPVETISEIVDNAMKIITKSMLKTKK